jgi:spore germination protein GerM
LYFIQVDRSGYISRVQANRKLPVSDSPLADVIQALIAGPSADEKNKGLISLIPPETKLLSASIRGNTAYLSFNEEFQYNTYGVEGYAGQLRQIVFTVTEFSNVADVQILIEGRRIDYLGEGVWVGSPVSRDML